MLAAEENLYQFYNAISKAKMVRKIRRFNCSVLSEGTGKWPQMVYNIKNTENPGKRLVELFETIEKNKYPNYVLMDTHHINQNSLEVLRSKHIFPVLRWELMELCLPRHLAKNNISDIQIREIHDEANIEEFGAVVNTELLLHYKIDVSLLNSLFQMPNMSILGLFYKEELVSTLLIFIHKTTAGLYFIATKKPFRGKGFAQELINFTLEFLCERGIRKVVLQSVQKAVPLYSRIGFSGKGKLVIFSKIKT